MADTTSSSSPNVNVEYVKSIQGILKICEIVLDVIVIICASVFFPFVALGGGWVIFVSVSALVLTLLLYIVYVMDVIKQIPHTIPRHLLEFIFCLVFAVFYLIAAIIASARGGIDSSVGACAFFAWLATVAYGVDTFFQFRTWQGVETGSIPSTTAGGATTTTTTTTHVSTVTTTGNVESAGWQQQY